MIEKYKDAGISDSQRAKFQNLHSIDQLEAQLEATNSFRNKLEINSTEEAFLSGSEAKVFLNFSDNKKMKIFKFIRKMQKSSS